MKKIINLIAIAASLSIFLSSCRDSEQCNYDKGYEAAWDGENEPSSFWASKKEKEGYEQGLDDIWMYDEGYYDGIKGQKLKYLNDPFYMDGFKDGKEDK